MTELMRAFVECGFKKNSTGKEWYLNNNKSKFELYPIHQKGGVYKLFKNACFICNISTAKRILMAKELLIDDEVLS